MDTIKLREFKHIVANFSSRKKASGYRINAESHITKALFDLIRAKMVEPVLISGDFIYLRPVKDINLKLSARDRIQLNYF